MRDFYDIYILTHTHSFDANIFKKALKRMVEKRQTTQQVPSGIEDAIATFRESGIMVDFWHKYQKNTLMLQIFHGRWL